jgi:hypothetical protein
LRNKSGGVSKTNKKALQAVVLIDLIYSAPATLDTSIARLLKMAESLPPAETTLYSELKAGSIRLVKLRRRAEDNELEATLEIKSFSQEPQYEALSWAWGNDVPDDQMIKFPLSRDGHLHSDFRIRPNLNTAFGRIMALTPVGEVRTLWADYISINQNRDDGKEDRRVQLGQMGEVYEKAQRVLVWLGDPPEGKEDIASCIELLPKIVESISTLAKEAGPGVEPHGYNGLPERNHRVWAVFSDIVRKDWYRRMWTLQETVLARDLTLHYGTNTFDWDQIVKLANAYGQAPLLRHLDDAREGYLWRWHHVMIANRYRLRRQKGMPIDFSHLLLVGTYKGCTKDVDRVYGVLGMAPKEVARGRIRIDPDRSVREVYLDALKVAVSCDTALHFLSFPFERGDKRLGLPTWVPDLSQWNGRDPQAQPAQRQALPATESSMRVLGNGRLRIRGVMMDRIGKVVHSPFPGPEVQEPMKRRRLLAAFYEESLKLTQSASGLLGGALPDDAHWQTLIQNAHGIHESFSTADARAGYKYYLVDAKFGKMDPRAHQTPEQQRLGAVFFHHLLHACNRRRYFKSLSGRVGLAPEKCQVGDVVCIFEGARVPHVLRRNVDDEQGGSRTFSFVGDCYVHGLMESETFDTETLRDFEIT